MAGSGWGALGGMALGGLLAAPTGGMSLGMGAALGGMGGGALESLFGGGGQTMEQGYDIVQLPQYSWTEPSLRLASDYLTQNLSRLGEGKEPVWWSKYKTQLREGMSRPNYQATFGRPGERTGTTQAAAQLGAMTGVGPKAAFAQQSKAVKDYADRELQIDEYLAGLGVDIQREGEGRYLTGILNQPRGPETQIVNRMGGVSGSSNQQFVDLMGSLGQMGMYGLMNQGQTTNPLTTAGQGMPLQWGNAQSGMTGLTPWNSYQTLQQYPMPQNMNFSINPGLIPK